MKLGYAFYVALVAIGCGMVLALFDGAAWGASAPHEPTPVYAFCGTHPDDPAAATHAATLKREGITATMGPCMKPDATYTPATPGVRYVDPDTYARLVTVNARAGLGTIVYDARLWSDDETVWRSAVAEWGRHRHYDRIVAFDLGDEYDPRDPAQWGALVERWGRVAERSGVCPFTNHLPWIEAFDAWAHRPSTASCFFSFDSYHLPSAVGLAKEATARFDRVMCAVNAFEHGPYRPNAHTVHRSASRLRLAGCDGILYFGGVGVYGMPEFGTTLLAPGSTETNNSYTGGI